MNSNKIGNQKTEVPETKDMNDKDFIATMLSIEKAMVKNYSVSLTEASCDDLYSDFFDMLREVSELQRDIYNLMFKKGWYSLELADETKISEKLSTFEKDFKQIEVN